MDARKQSNKTQMHKMKWGGRERGIYNEPETYMLRPKDIKGQPSNLNVVFLVHKFEVGIVAVGTNKLVDLVRVDIVAVH